MFSTAELNEITGLDYPDHKIVDWHENHMHMLHLNEHDAKWYAMYKNYAGVLASHSPEGFAFTGVGHGQVVCCFGFTYMWNGVYEAWLIPTTENIRKYVIPFHRASMRIFDYAMSKHSMKRLQITVSSENALALKWAERCYFNHEGVLQKYGPEGTDYYMMARY